VPAHWRSHVQIAECDIGPETRWSSLLHGMDVVVHLAGIAHGKESDRQRLRDVNVLAVRRLAEEAERSDVHRVVFLSSIGVNGNRTYSRPFDESMAPNPQDQYSRAKLEAEDIIRDVAERGALEYVLIRPPLVYGKGAPGNFGRLVGWIRSGVPLPFGAVKNLRSFVFVENLCHFLALTAVDQRVANQTYVVNDGEDIATPDLIRRLGTALGREARVLDTPLVAVKTALRIFGKSSDFDRLCGSLQIDSTKVRTTLSWSPPFDLSEGLRRSV
jgi:nucleoside-diphosphate-sugar epimerase